MTQIKESNDEDSPMQPKQFDHYRMEEVLTKLCRMSLDKRDKVIDALIN